MKTNISRVVMRRIWYAYVLQQGEAIMEQRAFWQGVVFGGALGVFAEVVHVASVIHNVLATPLGQVPMYVGATLWRALQTGDLVKVVTLLLLVGISLSILRKITPVFVIPLFQRHA